MSMLSIIAASRRRFNPLSLSPALWLDASDASTLYDATSGGSLVAADGAVARWEDKSGNERHATQGTSGARPLRKTGVQNGRDVVRFDGNDDLLAFSDFSYLKNSDPFSIFLITQTNQTSFAAIIQSQTGATEVGISVGLSNVNPNRLIFRLQSSGGRRQITSTTAVSTNLFLIIQCSYAGSAGDTGSMTTRVNGLLDTPSSITNTDSGEFQKTDNGTIGNRPVSSIPYNGDIAEILIFPTALSTADRERVERYLNGKYAIY